MSDIRHAYDEHRRHGYSNTAAIVAVSQRFGIDTDTIRRVLDRAGKDHRRSQHHYRQRKDKP